MITKEDLTTEYLENQLSTRDIAKKYNIGQTTVRRLMKKHGIQARDNKTSKTTIKSLQKQAKLADKYRAEYTIWYDKTCEFCGNPFRVSSSQKNKKFCSKECENESRRTLARDKDGLYLNQYKCKGCGKTFLNKSTNIIKRSYCDDCLPKWRSSHQITKVKTNCATCGKPMWITKSRFLTNSFNYCSIRCMSVHYKQRFSGENSPTWKGGSKNHYQGNWLAQRNKARYRDSYKCQICGKTEEELGKELSVHHIRLYRLYKDKTRANKLYNLVCLCPDCHSFIHSKKNKSSLYLNNSSNFLKIILRYSIDYIRSDMKLIKKQLEQCLGYLEELNRFLLSHLRDALFH